MFPPSLSSLGITYKHLVMQFKVQYLRVHTIEAFICTNQESVFHKCGKTVSFNKIFPEPITFS